MDDVYQMTRAKALAQGYKIDDHCNPPIAYSGPRFNPSRYFQVPSEEVEELQAELTQAREAEQEQRARAERAERNVETLNEVRLGQQYWFVRELEQFRAQVEAMPQLVRRAFQEGLDCENAATGWANSDARLDASMAVESVTLPDDVFDSLVDSLDNPARKPTERAQRAMDEYKCERLNVTYK